MEILKVVTIVEEIFAEGRRKTEHPIKRVASAAVIKNPDTGERSSDNLAQYSDMGKELGYVLAKAAMSQIGDGSDVQSFGKACIVGSNGELEQAAILIHKAFGASVREVIGGGKAGIPSTKKVAPAGTPIDVPVCFRDDSGLATHFDSMPVLVPGAPNADEILVVLVLTNGGRPHPWEGWQ